MPTTPVPPSTDTICDRLAGEGYAVVPGLFEPAALAFAREEVAGILAATPLGRDDFEGRKTRRIYALFAKTRAFDGPATHPVILAVLDRVLHSYQLSAPAGIEIGPGEVAQPLHPDDEVAVVEMPAGSTLLYLGSLWHGGGANHTDAPRVGVVLHYSASWLRPVENHVLAVPRDVVARLPVRLQELLGYNIGPPFIGYVDGRHPKHMLTN